MFSDRPAEVGDRAVPDPSLPGSAFANANVTREGWATSVLVSDVQRLARWSSAHHASPCFCTCGAGRVLERGMCPRMGQRLADPGAEAVRDAIAGKIMGRPADLRRSLTWKPGAEMAQHAQFQINTGLEIYFCGPQSPLSADLLCKSPAGQRGSTENTNGLLRQ